MWLQNGCISLGNSQSRQAFREMFPSTPTNADTLEIQQTELLRQQEESLKSFQNNNKRSEYLNQ